MVTLISNAGSHNKRRDEMRKGVMRSVVLAGLLMSAAPAVVAQSESTAAGAGSGGRSAAEIRFDFQDETVGAQPKSFLPIVGNFVIGAEGDNKVLVIDGRNWKEGQTAAGVA